VTDRHCFVETNVTFYLKLGYCTNLSRILQSCQRSDPEFPRLRLEEERDMSVKGCASTWWHHGFRPRRLVVPILLAVMTALFCGFLGGRRRSHGGRACPT